MLALPKGDSRLSFRFSATQLTHVCPASCRDNSAEVFFISKSSTALQAWRWLVEMAPSILTMATAKLARKSRTLSVWPTINYVPRYQQQCTDQAAGRHSPASLDWLRCCDKWLINTHDCTVHCTINWLINRCLLLINSTTGDTNSPDSEMSELNNCPTICSPSISV